MDVGRSSVPLRVRAVQAVVHVIACPLRHFIVPSVGAYVTARDQYPSSLPVTRKGILVTFSNVLSFIHNQFDLSDVSSLSFPGMYSCIDMNGIFYALVALGGGRFAWFSDNAPAQDSMKVACYCDNFFARSS